MPFFLKKAEMCLVSSELELLVDCIFIRGKYFSYMLSDSINCHVFSFLFHLESVFLLVLSAPFFSPDPGSGESAILFTCVLDAMNHFLLVKIQHLIMSE